MGLKIKPTDTDEQEKSIQLHSRHILCDTEGCIGREVTETESAGASCWAGTGALVEERGGRGQACEGRAVSGGKQVGLLGFSVSLCLQRRTFLSSGYKVYLSHEGFTTCFREQGGGVWRSE